MIQKLFKSSLFLVALTLATSSQAFDSRTFDKDYLSIESIEWTTLSEEEVYFETLKLPVQTQSASSSDIKPQFSAEQINAMIVLGQKAYDIVIKGQPVLNVQNQTWSVLPKSVTEARELSNWKDPVRAGYSYKAKNAYGFTVIDVRYLVQFVPGGQFLGKGSYLSHIAVIPTSIDVAWGYTLNVSAESREPLNVGSLNNPIAGFSTDVKIEVQTILKKSVRTLSTFVTGDGRSLPAAY